MNSELFERWRKRPLHKKQSFVKDGKLCPEKWDSRSSGKTLFLLKEAYDNQGRGQDWWDLSQMIQEWDRPYGRMWWTLAYWSYGVKNLINNRGQIMPFPTEESKWKKAAENLYESAVVNIKKSGGKKTSDWEDLKKYAEEDSDLIWEQICDINPRLVVCGGTWSIIKDYLPTPPKKEHDRLGDMVYDVNGRVFIDFWHPANRYPNAMNYYTLCSLIIKPEILDSIQCLDAQVA